MQTLVQDVGRMSRSMQYWKQVALAEEIRLKLLESNSILDRCVELFTVCVLQIRSVSRFSIRK